MVQPININVRHQSGCLSGLFKSCFVILLLVIFLPLLASILLREPIEQAKEKASQKIATGDPPADAARQREDRKAAAAKQQQNYDTFHATLQATGTPSSLSMLEGSQFDGDTIIITVANTWHLMPYQLRLQAAQNLWQTWAKIASPQDLDRARLKLVDLNGNEVGGSRFIAGSAIWVQEN